jgi:hypothetical protein
MGLGVGGIDVVISVYSKEDAKSKLDDLQEAQDSKSGSKVGYKDMLLPGGSQLPPSMITILGQANQALRLQSSFGLWTSNLPPSWIRHPEIRIPDPPKLHFVFPYDDFHMVDYRRLWETKTYGLGINRPCHLLCDPY